MLTWQTSLPSQFDGCVTFPPSTVPNVGRANNRQSMPRIAAIGTPLGGNTVRLAAITNVEAYVPPAISFDPGETPGEVFGSSVFTKAEMQARLPKAVYKSIVATIDKGASWAPRSPARA